RERGSLEQPFVTRDNAKTILRWLKTVQDRLGGKLEAKEQANLAMATWYKSGDPDRETRETSRKLALAALKQEQAPRDILLLRFIHARSCDKDLDGRTESLESYLAALAPARELLKKDQADKVAFYL